jgi:uncharacterized protein (DUF1800 family)
MKSIARAWALLLVCFAGPAVVPAADAGALVTIMPLLATLRGGVQQRFTATVYLNTNKAISWTVNGVPGGNAVVGSITPDGLYTAPPVLPGGAITIVATSVADPRVSAKAVITLLNPTPAISSVTPSAIAPGPFTLTIDGSGFTPTSIVRYGATSLATTWLTPTRLLAVGTGATVIGGMVPVTVRNPDPGLSTSNPVPLTIADPPAHPITALAAGRFLEQTSWGPNPAAISRVQQVGFEAYLDEQFAQPSSVYPEYPNSMISLLPVQQRFVANALSGQDQLRQRVAFALSQIFVVSGYKEFAPQMMVPYLRLLSDHAFDSYGLLLKEVSLSPTMGHFLNMANNQKANPTLGTAPNENFARELLQLFTIGVDRLNPDGLPQLDAAGRRIPTYDQAVIAAMARAFTGWTYPTKPGATPLKVNPLYFVGRMEQVPSTHDLSEKVVIDGAVLPANQTAQQDLDQILALLIRHPNTGPFLARRLIQSLVTSNPSSAYVERVAAVFATAPPDTGPELRDVVKAIVLDPEARRGDSGEATTEEGHLREPVLYAMALLRALGATASDNSLLINLISPAGQSLFYPATVFSYFPVDFDLPSGVRAPEFQIFTPSTSIYRANLAFSATFGFDAYGITIDQSSFEALASDPPQLVEAVNRALLYGRMSPEMRQSIEVAVGTVTNLSPWTRAATAIYLVASSSQYQVQR